MQLEARAILEDMRQAAALIAQFTAGKTLDDYLRDALLRSGVERQFEIVGEAMNRLRKLDAAISAGISHSDQIIAFRNVLIHGYDRIDDRVVWDVVKKYLPVLTADVQALLGDGE